MRGFTVESVARARREGGFVLILVLFVLLALFALTAPFLATARNADAASHYVASDVQLRLALDGAGRHARFSLEGTHPALDPTPYFDSAEELHVGTNFPAGLIDPANATGVSFGIEATDVAGLIDLNSASPQVLSNLLGSTARLSAPAGAGATSFRTTSPGTYPPGTVLSVDGELIKLGQADEDEPQSVQVEERGLGTAKDEEGVWQTTGPAPPSTHGVGAYVFDQRSFAPALWRTLSPTGDPQVIDTLEEIRAADPFSLSGGFDDGALLALRRTATAQGSLGAGPVWQRSTRLIAPLEAGVSYDLRPDQGRWMAPGSTIKISDGVNTELRVVTRRTRDGRVLFDRVVDYDYDAFLTEVWVLAKRPVNINTASPEVLVALLANLSLAGQNHRIDDAEARGLAAAIIQSRPFTGFEDFVGRMVLPAGGIDVLPEDAPVRPSAFEDDASIFNDPRDAVALYINALNANDARLEFATMPFAFTTRQVFTFELRANISAKSGIARASGVRDRMELVVPQVPELFQVFTRQEDFDDILRLTRGAPYWLTGPETTGRYDAGVTPPSRLTPHLGTLRGSSYIPGINEPVNDADGNAVQADRVYASRGDNAFLQLEPIRLAGTPRTRGRILHFDQESRTLEGRYLPDETVARGSADGVVRWTGFNAQQVVEPLTFSMWVRPEVGGDGTFLSIGDRTQDSDRIVLGMTGGNLVLRVIDGMGDHRDTTFREVSEVRFPLANGAGSPGMPVGVWSHVAIDVRGNRPDQIGLLVNGNATGVERDGMTRLTSALGASSGAILVDSTEGFPAVCVLRIGNELIEARVTSGNTFTVLHEVAGEFAGFGGRLARVRFDVEGSDSAAPVVGAFNSTAGSYAVGTPVVHYGYSMPLTSNVPSGRAQLPGELGPFRVGKVVGRANDNTLVPVQAQGLFGPFNLGRGWDSQVTGDLTLALADRPDAGGAVSELMAAFDPTGGYAVLSGPIVTLDGGDVLNPSGDAVGGVEVIRYSGVSGDKLRVVERGVQLQRFQGSTNTAIGNARSFIFDWEVLISVNQQTYDPDTILGASTFCYPISLSVPGANGLSFAQPQANISQFAQITRVDDPEQTEWVRYDEVDLANSQLVRSDPNALMAVYNILYNLPGSDLRRPNPGGGGGGGGPTTPGGGSGPGTPGGGGNFNGGPGSGGNTGSGGSTGTSSLVITQPPSPAANPSAPVLAIGSIGLAQQGGASWDPLRGQDPNVDFPLSQAVASVLHFRGVLGTRIGTHPAGTLVLPVVEMRGTSIERGRPGARDPVFIVDGTLGSLGYPVTVHRSHWPAASRMSHNWSAVAGIMVADDGSSVSRQQVGFNIQNTFYVAFDDAVLIPTSPGSGNGSIQNVTDSRFLGRMVKFPSGELPRSGSSVTIGTGAGGLADFGVASCTVDEIVFGNAEANAGYALSSPAAHTAGAPLLLNIAATAGDMSFTVLPNTVRVANGTMSSVQSPISAFPPDGGLVRIGEEIIAYITYSTGNGSFQVAIDGRGLFGTLPQPHAVSEAVHWLEAWEMSTLSTALGPDGAVVRLVSTQNFPTEGTALIGRELIHYTQVNGGALVMPRSSNTPGAMDGLGPGVFRGRYGTPPGSYPVGTPVILFPARYWDRYAPRFEGPELGFFGLHVDQPGAWWGGVTWDSEASSLGGAEIIVLQRAGDVPWDADPQDEPALTLLEDGISEGNLVPIGLQSDRIEWRVFARYAAGSFDAEFGLQHGWKQSPRFNYLGVSYSAPGRVLKSLER